VILSHAIALKPTTEQEEYFLRACGTVRKVWNWALDEWKKIYESGGRPSANALKKQFNAIKYQKFPWLKEIHRDAHSQPFAYLQKAWQRFFEDIKKGYQIAPDCKKQQKALKNQGVKLAYKPQFKKKGQCVDSFYVANDKFRLENGFVVLPKIGQVSLAESLRFTGNILGAVVKRKGLRWFLVVKVEVPDAVFYRKRTGDNVVGMDLGIKDLAIFSNGKIVPAVKPLKRSLRRLKIRSRRLSRKLEAAKLSIGIPKNKPIPKDTKLPVSKNRLKAQKQLTALHGRIAHLRKDVADKLTTMICRENQTVVMEDLNVQGMIQNRKLAQAIQDVGFAMIRHMLEYKAKRYGATIIFANRWYPSSKLCSVCGVKYDGLTLSERSWTCQACGTTHDRDLNAAKNLLRLATATALPVASSSSNGDAMSGMVPGIVGKVTPVRYECGHEDTSGQEQNCEHVRSRFG